MDRSAGPILDNFGFVGCSLSEAAMRSVRVVVVDVFAEELVELSVVPDEGAVAEFAADGADPVGADNPFGRVIGELALGSGVCDGGAGASKLG